MDGLLDAVAFVGELKGAGCYTSEREFVERGVGVLVHEADHAVAAELDGSVEGLGGFQGEPEQAPWDREEADSPTHRRAPEKRDWDG